MHLLPARAPHEETGICHCILYSNMNFEVMDGCPDAQKICCGEGNNIPLMAVSFIKAEYYSVVYLHHGHLNFFVSCYCE